MQDWDVTLPAEKVRKWNLILVFTSEITQFESTEISLPYVKLL